MKTLRSTLLLGALTASLMTLPAANAKSWIETQPESIGTQADLTTGRPVIMRAETAFSDIMVADDKVADVVVLTDKSFQLMGKTSGRTNIMLYDNAKRLIDIVEVNVGYDVAALKKGLYQTFPRERIEIREMAGGVYMSGNVTTASVSERAMQIAQRFAPDNVNNGLIVKDSHQVLLEVRFIEASREAIKDLGVGLLVGSPGDGSFSSRTGLLAGAIPAARGLLETVSGTTAIDVQIDALEEQGVIRTLAEPNLVAMSGETASFLAGGEFPIPIEGNLGGVTIEYRKFGVGLSFTPTVLDDGLINLKVAPEVSQIDTNRSVRIGGVEVPALTVRRADTTVELRNDQSFAIAGLLQNSRTDSKVQVPWLGDVPVLGSLFRSTRYRKNETELVILITPRLVHPVSDMSKLATPLDGMSAPNEGQQFLLGQIEGERTSRGGLSSAFGHVIQ